MDSPPISAQPSQSQPGPGAKLRARRLRQIATLAGCGILARLVGNILGGVPFGSSQLALLGGLGLTLYVLWLNQRGKTDAGNLILLAAVTLMISALAWNNEGLSDTALFAYPGILIMAGLLVRPKYFIGLFVCILGFICVLGWGTVTGFYTPVFNPTYSAYYRACDVLIILVVSGLSMQIVVSDLHAALAESEQAVARAVQTQANLTYLAQHDALTDLPNRLLGRDRIEQALNNARRHSEQVAVLFVDLDGFKAINDSLGHDAGDEFLQQVAARLVDSVRQSDVVSRQGGDEFLISINDVADHDSISTTAAKILARLSQPVTIAGTLLAPSGSIGIAVFPNDGTDFETLLQHADQAMYQAKSGGRNTFRFYDPAMNASIAKAANLGADLRDALAAQQFVLHYQPVVDIATGQLSGAEALLRWQHPTRGLLPAAEFINAAEKSGLIVAIGEWVVQDACRQAMAWQTQGVAPFVLALNLSSLQFKRGDIETVLGTALARSGLAPGCLELELNEATLTQDADKFIPTVQRLKASGVRIAVDDFGTGYSNLSALQQVGVGRLKIARSFVADLDAKPQNLAVISAIIQMAKSLKLSTTAVGIEAATTCQKLASLGCTHAQGYLFAKPQAAQEFGLFMRESRQRAA